MNGAQAHMDKPQHYISTGACSEMLDLILLQTCCPSESCTPTQLAGGYLYIPQGTTVHANVI